MAAIKGEFTITGCFFYFFLDLDVYVLYQSSFGIFLPLKSYLFYLYFIYLKNRGKNIS